MSPQNSPDSDESPFKADIVNNIPIHTAGGLAAPPAPQKNEDVDRIMRDVGDQIAKEDRPKPKHHFFSKPKPQEKTKSSPVIDQPLRPQTAPVAANASQPAAKTQAKPAKPKSSVPVLAIFLTIIVTGGLIALAVITL